MCDDIDATVDELRAKGAQFRSPIEKRDGRIIMMIVLAADDMQLYQPTRRAGVSSLRNTSPGDVSVEESVLHCPYLAPNNSIPNFRPWPQR